MSKSLALAAVLFACAGYSGAAYAQGFAEACIQNVDDLCGDNQSVIACFEDQSKWDEVDNECVGDVQTMIEMEREVAEEQSGQSGVVFGKSYGGVLRSGPGQEYGRVARLREGDSIEILEPSGVWFNEYQWYRISSNRGGGYHWGGIICSDDELLEGVFTVC